MSFIQTLVDHILKNAEVKVSESYYDMQLHMKLRPEDHIRAYLSEQFHDEFAHLNSLAEDRAKFEEQKLEHDRLLAAKYKHLTLDFEVKERELQRDQKIGEIKLTEKLATLELALDQETDDQKKMNMQTAVENIALKDKIAYLETELTFARKMSSDVVGGMTDTLKTAFQNQPTVTVNNA